MTTKQIVTHKQTVWQTVWSLNNRQSERQTVWTTDSLNDRQTHIHKRRQTARQTDIHADTQTHLQMHPCTQSMAMMLSIMVSQTGPHLLINPRLGLSLDGMCLSTYWDLKTKRERKVICILKNTFQGYWLFKKILYQLPIGLDVGCL